MLIPGGLVSEVHFHAPRPIPDSHIVEKNRLRNSIHEMLDSSGAYWNTQHRLDELSHTGSAATLTSTQLSNEPVKPRPVSNLKPLRNHTLADPSSSRAFPFLQDEIRNLHLDFWKLDTLMSVERSEVLKSLTSTATWLGWHRHDFGGYPYSGGRLFPVLFADGKTRGKILERHPGTPQFQLFFALCSFFQSPSHENLVNVLSRMRAWKGSCTP